MPTESELRDWMRGAGADVPTRLDAARIIRRSKRRRLPRQVGAGGVLTLAVAGISVASITGLKTLAPNFLGTAGSQTSDRALPSQESDSGAPAVRDAGPAARLNSCGAPLATVAPDPSGLRLTPHFPASAPADGRPVTGTVTLTNTGGSRAVGTTAAGPTIALSRDGVVLWHSNGPAIALAAAVDLAPGESMDYPATFTPVRCTAEDELTGGFPDDLPALGTGRYRISAAIDLNGDAPRLITGETATITLR